MIKITSRFSRLHTGHRNALLWRQECFGAAFWVALCIATFTGCNQQRQEQLRIAINPWPGTEFLYLAQEKGFLAAEGVNAQLVEYSSLGDTRVAFESGQVDAFSCTLVELMQAREHSGRKPQVALVSDYSNGADVILAKEGIQDAAGLDGKRVAVEFDTLGVYMLAQALAAKGLKLSDVEMVPCPQDGMRRALTEDRVDAVVTYPPVSVGILKDGDVHEIFSSADIPGKVLDVVAVDSPILDRDPQLPARLAKAVQRAMDYAQQHPEDAYQLMGRRQGLTAAEFRGALSGLKLVSAEEQKAYFTPQGNLEASMREVAAALKETKQLKLAHEPSEMMPPHAGTN